MGTNWWRVLGASVMFAGFLFVFRVLAWRRIIKDLGRADPRRARHPHLVDVRTRPLPARRHLAGRRPGVPLQALRRQRPVCSTSQVLELAIFLLANLIMAVAASPSWRSTSTASPAGG